MDNEKTFDEFYEISKDIIENVIVPRNQNYGTDNLVDGGAYGIILRISDKLARMKYRCKKNLFEKDMHKEGFNQDSKEFEDWMIKELADIFGYCLVGMNLRKQGKI